MFVLFVPYIDAHHGTEAPAGTPVSSSNAIIIVLSMLAVIGTIVGILYLIVKYKSRHEK